MQNFRVYIWLRVLLLTLSILLLGGLIWHWKLIAAPVLVGIIILAQIFDLNRYLNRTQQALEQFFRQVAYDDFTQEVALPDRSQTSVDLQQQMQEVVAQFQAIRLEKEESFRYLEQVIQHLGVPTLALHDQQIRYMNAAARRLLGTGFIREVRELPGPIRKLLQELRPGQQENIRWLHQGESMQLLASRSEFKLQTQTHSLLTLQDIQAEIDQTELKAWHKLTRVLHHEIMNSVTPMLTLAETVKHQLFNSTDQYVGALLDNEQQQDLRKALRLLHNRGENLQHFVSDYKAATQLPLPKRTRLDIKPFLQDISGLLLAYTRQSDITLRVSCESASLTIQADRELLEQVLINLILNAVQALQGQPDALIEIAGRENLLGIIEISVRDNGPGIAPGQLEEIFVPFYTTRPDGSGLGLAISKQIMQAHGGQLIAQSTPGQGAIFTLRFPR
ncbi:MAG: ATP-binding protein [Bacteroidota bacterium]